MTSLAIIAFAAIIAAEPTEQRIVIEIVVHAQPASRPAEPDHDSRHTCLAITQSRRRCTRFAVPGLPLCRMHGLAWERQMMQQIQRMQQMQQMKLGSGGRYTGYPTTPTANPAWSPACNNPVFRQGPTKTFAHKGAR
jgi:hypothetical protein